MKDVIDEKKSYLDKLKDPRWQKKRLLILERDGWACRLCHDTENTLHVHHKIYIRGNEPWEYEDGLLISLCEDCHLNEALLKKEYEPLIIETLYKNFSADNLRELAIGFSKIKMTNDPQIMASIISFAISDEKIMDYLSELFFSDLNKILKNK